MKLQKILPLSCIAVSLAALPALAGSSYVENSYRLRSITGGTSTTNVDVSEIYSGWRKADSTAVKTEWGTTTVTEAKDGRTFHETESFDITARSGSWERGDFTKTTDVNVTEVYHFTGFEKDHRVTSGFDF